METGQAVVDNLLRRKKAERVAVMDGPWSDSILRWVAQGYPTRMVYKEVGKKCWRPEDGRTVDVEVAGEYVEPVPPVGALRLRHDRGRRLVRSAPQARLQRAARRDRRVGGQAQRRRRGAQILEAQDGHARAHGLPDDLARDLGARLPPATCSNSTSSASAIWRRPGRTWRRHGRWAAGRTWATCSSGRGCARAWAT